MAINSVLQTIKNAEIDARSLSEFVFNPADAMVSRRLAPSIHTLNYYLRFFDRAVISAKEDAKEIERQLLSAQQQAQGTVSYIENTIRDAIDTTVIENSPVSDALVSVDGSLSQRTINKGLESISDLSTINNPKDGLRVYVKSHHAGIGKGGGYFTYDSSKVEENDGGYVVDGWVRDISEGITSPYQFGVIADGITNDTESLRKYHNYCNLRNISADYTGISKIALNSDAKIEVNTSTDFKNCKINMLNGIKENISSTVPLNIVFVVSDIDTPLIAESNKVLDASKAKKGSVDISPDGLDLGGSYVNIRAPLTRVAGRYAGNSTTSYVQSFYVGRDGFAVKPLSKDIDGADITVRYRKDSTRGKIELSNLYIGIDGSFNRQCFVEVQRNNVTLSNVVVENVDGGYDLESINSLLSVSHCSNVVISNLHAKSLDNNASSGTYVLLAHGCSELFLDKITASGSWGWMGSNEVNGLYMTNSTVNRVDGHTSLHNVYVRDTTFVDSGVSFGSGGGVIILEGITLINSCAIQGRYDYGTTFDGDVIINNVSAVGSSDILVSSRYFTNGVTAPLFNNISITNVTFSGVPSGETRNILTLVPASTASAAYFPDNVYISNVVSASDVSLSVNMQYNAGIKKGTSKNNITIKDIKCYIFKPYFNGQLLPLELASDVLDPKPIDLKAVVQDIETSNEVWFQATIPFERLTLNSVQTLGRFEIVRGIVNDRKQRITIYNSTLYHKDGQDQRFDLDANTGSNNIRFFNCSLGGGVVINSADSFIGCRAGSTVTLPSTATPELVFTGWTRS